MRSTRHFLALVGMWQVTISGVQADDPTSNEVDFSAPKPFSAIYSYNAVGNHDHRAPVAVSHGDYSLDVHPDKLRRLGRGLLNRAVREKLEVRILGGRTERLDDRQRRRAIRAYAEEWVGILNPEAQEVTDLSDEWQGLLRGSPDALVERILQELLERKWIPAELTNPRIHAALGYSVNGVPILGAEAHLAFSARHGRLVGVYARLPSVDDLRHADEAFVSGAHVKAEDAALAPRRHRDENVSLDPRFVTELGYVREVGYVYIVPIQEVKQEGNDALGTTEKVLTYSVYVDAVDFNELGIAVEYNGLNEFVRARWLPTHSPYANDTAEGFLGRRLTTVLETVPNLTVTIDVNGRQFGRPQVTKRFTPIDLPDLGPEDRWSIEVRAENPEVELNYLTVFRSRIIFHRVGTGPIDPDTLTFNNGEVTDDQRNVIGDLMATSYLSTALREYEMQLASQGLLPNNGNRVRERVPFPAIHAPIQVMRTSPLRDTGELQLEHRQVDADLPRIFLSESGTSVLEPMEDDEFESLEIQVKDMATCIPLLAEEFGHNKPFWLTGRPDRGPAPLSHADSTVEALRLKDAITAVIVERQGRAVELFGRDRDFLSPKLQQQGVVSFIQDVRNGLACRPPRRPPHERCELIEGLRFFPPRLRLNVTEAVNHIARGFLILLESMVDHHRDEGPIKGVMEFQALLNRFESSWSSGLYPEFGPEMQTWLIINDDDPDDLIDNGTTHGELIARMFYEILLRHNFFLRGDVNLDGEVALVDPLRLFNMLFLRGPHLGCFDAADVNDSGSLDITDGIFSLSFLFLGGPPPAPPFPECGIDAVTPFDELTCVEEFCDPNVFVPLGVVPDGGE